MQLTTSVLAILAAVASAAPAFNPSSGKGDMTYFTPSVGSCGFTNNANQLVVALSPSDMKNGANPNSNPRCGKMITITYKGKTATGKLVDTCPGCAAGDVNVSPALFKRIAPLSKGRLHNVSWKFA